MSFSNGEELKCKFEYFLRHYSCRVQDFVATNDHVKIERITGLHMDGKTDDDVENLYFEDQKVPYLPIGIDQHFKSLKSMSVKNSSVEHINNDALKMENLSELTFEFNNIKDIAENTFQSLRKLQSLNLASNHITKLHSNTFKNMNELKILNLNWNQLELLDAGVFNDCKMLQTLYLRQNKLKVIDKSILDPLEGLQYIYLQGNVCVDRNDYFDFVELKAEIASKCVDACADRLKTITDGYNLKFMELQKAIYHANDRIEQLSSEISVTNTDESKEERIPHPATPEDPEPTVEEIENPENLEDLINAIKPDSQIIDAPKDTEDIEDPDEKVESSEQIIITEVGENEPTVIRQKLPNGKTDTYLSFKFTNN